MINPFEILQPFLQPFSPLLVAVIAVSSSVMVFSAFLRLSDTLSQLNWANYHHNLVEWLYERPFVLVFLAFLFLFVILFVFGG